MLKNFHWILIVFVTLATQAGIAESKKDNLIDLKKKILMLAKSYEGQGDPDQSKQKLFIPLIEKLVSLNPMPPIKDRLPIITGAWKQVWGPYDYRNDSGGIDPTLGIKEIYQVVFAEGYYYNIAPIYPNEDKNREQVGLLRGEFTFDPKEPFSLKVKFTDYPGVEPRPAEKKIWQLASLAESDQLQNEITIVPSWVVKLFFGQGKLEEVYTDHNLRIIYGSKDKTNARRSLYIMSRVN